jgi:XRE family aerobic/anaerobic benzoate catabolism transcriptional regulator
MARAARKARMERQDGRPALLTALGARVRELREARGQTRRALSAASGLSERFLADIEAGEGNISLQRLDELGRALGTTSVALLSRAQAKEAAAPEGLRALLAGLSRDELQEAQRWLKARFGGGGGPLVALLGLRGAGKSTIGRKLSQRLSLPFVELDEMVERAAGLSLAGLFSLHGEAYYRRMAREILTAFLAETDAAVIAIGGSLVTDRDAYGLLQKRCTTVWLQARAEDHWQRVLAQGDERPGAASPHAQAELRALLKAREPLYAQAHLAVDTSKLGVQGAVESIAKSLAGGRG